MCLMFTIPVLKMAILAVFVVLACFGPVCTSCQQSHYGTSFNLGMVPMHSSYNPETILDIASNESGRVTLSSPFLNINTTYSLNNGLNTIYLAKTLIKRGNFTENRGFHVQTDVCVAVYVTLHNSDVAESYLALPDTFTGRTYIIAAFKPYGTNEYSDVLVVGNRLNTVVNVTSTRTTTSSVSLNWLDAKQISLNIDTSGIVISANASVSVTAGTTCAHVPQNYTNDCGFIVEQMIPANAWEKEYIVPNMPPRKGVLIRVLSLQHQDVCFYTQQGSTCKQVPFPHPLEFATGSEPVYVRSNSTISVMSYGIEGGPFMISVPGIKNFMNEYHFIVPSLYTYYNNSLAVVIQSTQTSGIFLDGSSVNSVMHVFNVSQPYDSYKVLIVSISIGYHTLSHQSTNVKFGAFLYGNGHNEGYGFPLGMQKETAKVSDAGHVCYNCKDMFHIELCDVVKRCSENEVCSKESETAGNDPDTCIDCCSKSYCNHKGCGETGLAARDQRGPLCYDCEYTFSTDECDTVKLCDEGQVCSIEETKWGTNSNFRMGCAHASCSPVKRSVHVSARSTPICQSCCSEDYCNLNCTMGPGHGQPVIVG